MDRFFDIEAFYCIFRDISKSVHSCSDLQEVLDLVVRRATQVVNAKGAILRIISPDASRLELSAAHGLSEQYLSKGVVSSAIVITNLCRQKKVILVEDVQTNPRVQYPKEAQAEGIRSMLDLPLTLNGQVIGIIRLFFSDRRKFSQEHCDFLEAIAEQCALAIDKARLIEKQQSQYNHLAIQTEKLSALGRMAAGIAHEINNPLGSILLYASNMIKKIPKEGALHKGMDIIISETRRCKHIIQDLLEFSRDETPHRERVGINEILDKSITLLANQFRLKHIRVERELCLDMPGTLLDAKQLEQVFINILINAIEAVENKGLISVRTLVEADCQWLRVEISDNGNGIMPEFTARVFEPFFSTKPKGSGLGLAVSYSIVRNHQGNIQVTSTPGKGTCFTVKLPIIQITGD